MAGFFFSRNFFSSGVTDAHTSFPFNRLMTSCCFKPCPLRATAQSPTARLAMSSADRRVVSSSGSIAGKNGLIGIPCVFNSASERFLRLFRISHKSLAPGPTKAFGKDSSSGLVLAKTAQRLHCFDANYDELLLYIPYADRRFPKICEQGYSFSSHDCLQGQTRYLVLSLVNFRTRQGLLEGRVFLR